MTEIDPALPPAPQHDPSQPVNRYGARGALTAELQDRIVQVVAAGNYLKTAAQFAGIGSNTLSVWLARGRAAAALADAGEPVPPAEERYLSFLTAVTQAETTAEIAAVTHWRRAFADDWRAARDYLGRKRPEQWAAKTTVSISSEEAEARIERATLEALTALGVDTGEPAELGVGDDPGDLDGIEPVDF
jgi:hypothetical protein